MRRIARIVVSLVLLIGAGSASATQYECVGSVSGVSLSKWSGLYIENFAGSNWLLLCNFDTYQNGVSPTNCKNAYALLLAAQLSGKSVRIWFDDAQTCATHTPWAQVNWTNGPELMP